MIVVRYSSDTSRLDRKDLKRRKCRSCSAEITSDPENGRTHKKGSVEDLCRVLEELIESPEQRLALGKTARQWVVENRDWDVLGRKFVDLCEELHQLQGRSLQQMAMAS